jgi:hypothetical protein
VEEINSCETCWNIPIDHLRSVKTDIENW